MLYDGDCPLCMKEVNSLRNADNSGNINFVDIAASDYAPSQHANISYEEVTGQMDKWIEPFAVEQMELVPECHPASFIVSCFCPCNALRKLFLRMALE